MKKTSGRQESLPLALLFGAGAGALLLLLSTLILAGLIWGGLIPAKAPRLVLSLLASLCAFSGGRVAVRRWKGGTLVAGGLTGLILCGLLAFLCLGTAGRPAFPGPWFVALAMVLAGGCLAGLGGRKKK